VGGRRKRSANERSIAAGKRSVQVHNAKTSGKSAHTGEDLLKAKVKKHPAEEKTRDCTKRRKAKKSKSKKSKITNNKKSINNKRKN